MRYKTKHRDELLKFLKKHEDEHLTIQEISKMLKGKIPQATIYRLIATFEKEGLVRKYSIASNEASCYQFVDDDHCHEHFHLVCEKCGKVIHLECDEVNHLLGHIDDEHNFKINTSKVNLYGLCKECQKSK